MNLSEDEAGADVGRRRRAEPAPLVLGRRRVVLRRLRRPLHRELEADRAAAGRGVDRHNDPVPRLPVEVGVVEYPQRSGEAIDVAVGRRVAGRRLSLLRLLRRRPREIDEPVRRRKHRKIVHPLVDADDALRSVRPRGDHHTAAGSHVDPVADPVLYSVAIGGADGVRDRVAVVVEPMNQ